MTFVTAPLPLPEVGHPERVARARELLEGEEDPAHIRASLGVLQRHIARINRTLREMTDFSRRRRDEVTEVSVEVVIHDSLRLVRHDPRSKQVQVELRLARIPLRSAWSRITSSSCSSTS